VPHHPARAKRIIFLFMSGGPSQVDTFDPKPLLKKRAGETLTGVSVGSGRGELGVLKAIGFTNGQVLGLVLAESCMLTVIGGGLGLAIASAAILCIFALVGGASWLASVADAEDDARVRPTPSRK
jgi:hypothetical protein